MERVIVKAMYVVGYCTLAAFFAGLAITDIDGLPGDSGRFVGAVGGVLLFALLLVALWLGTRGRLSASWLTLAYGSAMTTDIMLFLATLSPEASDWREPWGWITLVSIAGFCIGGGRPALRGQWGALLPWWLGSFCWIVPYGLWTTLR